MADLTVSVPAVLPAGEIIAGGISAEDYLAQYAETYHEWVKGNVIKMSPISEQHDLLTVYLRLMLDTYFDLKSTGCARNAPFVMRLESAGAFREPDIQIILKENPGQLTDTAMIGPADVCIEIVSPESASRDYGDKFVQYEAAGVREYWIIDPLRADARFYRQGEDALYASIQLDEDGSYRTPLLPGLAIHVPTLWRDELPTRIETVQTVQSMVEKA